MNAISISFWFFVISTLILISSFGGGEGRRFTVVILICVCGTFFANSTLDFFRAQPIVLLIDLLLLGYAINLVRESCAYWPIWFAGFHFIGASAGIGYRLFPTSIPELYIDTSGIWAIPALGAAAIGVFLDYRVVNRHQ